MRKYMNRATTTKQLSIISEKSNSNHDEQSFKDKSVEFDDKHCKNVVVDTSQVREIVDPRNDKLFQKTNRDYARVEKEEEKKFSKNSYPYLNEANGNDRLKENNELRKEYSFERFDKNMSNTRGGAKGE